MRRRAVAVAVVALTLTLVTNIASGVIEILRPASLHGVPPPTPADFQYLANAILSAVAGLLIARRRPNNVLWAVLAGLGIFGGLFGLSSEYTIHSELVASTRLPATEVAAAVSAGVFPTIPSLTMLLLLLFPTGRPLTPRWRFAPWLVLAGFLLLTTGTALHVGWVQNRPQGSSGPIHNPLAIPGATPVLDLATMAGVILLGAASLLGLASLALRYRRGSNEERHQVKWLLYAAAFAPVGFLVYPATSSEGPLTPFALLALALEAVGVLGIPVAIGVAILKYRLYDIDLVISRTLVYGALGAFITAVYVGIVVGVGALVGSGGRPNLVLSIVATAVVAVAFQPVRERLQRLANRLVYGKRATPYEVLSDFSSRIAESYSGDDLLLRMAQVLAAGTGGTAATVWLRSAGELRPAATYPMGSNGHAPVALTGQILPALPGAARSVAVRHQGELLGALTVQKRTGEALTPIEEKLLDDLAHQAGLVLKNVGLTSDLQERLHELTASRLRVVAAQDEERRRLERNLHDGAQQHLVALKVKLGLVGMLMHRDPDRARVTIQQLKGDADEALETLRDLARGIYPPLLADRGLGAALEAQARKATIPVEVRAEGIGRYPQDIEAAVYFCCLEALQNVQKYAGATQAEVRLHGDSGGLHVEVSDDGQGFDPAAVRRGAGLQNMEDRLASLGGSLVLDSVPGGGTTVRGRVPLLSAVPAA